MLTPPAPSETGSRTIVSGRRKASVWCPAAWAHRHSAAELRTCSVQQLPMRPVVIENQPAGAAMTLARDVNGCLRAGGRLITRTRSQSPPLQGHWRRPSLDSDASFPESLGGLATIERAALVIPESGRR